MIPVIFLLDLKHTTYIPNLISNYCFYCEKITTVHEMRGDGGFHSPLHRQCGELDGNNRHRNMFGFWTLTAFSVRGRRHDVDHGDDETRVERKRKTSPLACHNKRLWLNVSDWAAGHEVSLISAVGWSCWTADAVMGWECSSSLTRQNVNRQDVLPHLRALPAILLQRVRSHSPLNCFKSAPV